MILEHALGDFGTLLIEVIEDFVSNKLLYKNI